LDLSHSRELQGHLLSDFEELILHHREDVGSARSSARWSCRPHRAGPAAQSTFAAFTRSSSRTALL
jgi:hypothetical protein